MRVCNTDVKDKFYIKNKNCASNPKQAFLRSLILCENKNKTDCDTIWFAFNHSSNGGKSVIMAVAFAVATPFPAL